jgi:hypothetical protein
MCLPATRPAPHRLDKIQPESVQKHSKSERVGADRGGSVRFCGLGGFLPSPTQVDTRHSEGFFVHGSC